MAGLLHIFRLDPQHEPFDKLMPQYQANYETPGNNYGGAFTEPQLKEVLLHTALGFDDARIHDIISELHRTGNFTIADVEIPIPETGMLGLEQEPSDF